MRKNYESPSINIIELGKEILYCTNSTCHCGNIPDGGNSTGGCANCPDCTDCANKDSHFCSSKSDFYNEDF